MPINVCLYNCSNCFAKFFSLSAMFADGNKTKTVTSQRGTHSPKHCCIVTSHVCIQILTSSKVAKAYFRRVCKFHPFDQRIHKKDVFRWESSKIVCNFLASQMHSTQISALYAACAREWFLLFFVESMHATATVCVSTLKFTFNYPQRLCLFFIQRPFPPPHWHRTHAFNRRIRRFCSVPEKSDWVSVNPCIMRRICLCRRYFTFSEYSIVPIDLFIVCNVTFFRLVCFEISIA